MGEVARVQVSPCARTVWVRAYGDFSREPEKDKLWNFPGYRFALYMYSTLKSGGHADFDWFRLSGPAS